MDSGWSWVVLVGIFINTTLTFGYLQCIGIFLVDWQEEFDASAQTVGWTSAFFIGGFGCSGPVSSTLSGYLTCRRLTFCGGTIAFIALLCGNAVTLLSHLFIVMMFAGFGIGLAFIGSIVAIGYYFDKRFALATGIGLSGVGVGLFAFAPLTRYLNDQYSWKGTMTIYAALTTNVCVFGALFRPTKMEENAMKGLPHHDGTELQTKADENAGDQKEDETKALNIIPNECVTRLSETDNIRQNTSWSQHIFIFLATYKKIFSVRFTIVCILGAFLTGLGYYSAVVYYVAHAVSIDISKRDAAFLLSIVGICSTFGRLGYGSFVDRGCIAPLRLATLTQGIAGVSCLLCPLAKSYLPLVIISVVLGLSTGTTNALFTVLIREVVGVQQLKKAFGIMIVTWNVGGLIGLPLMGYIYDSTGAYTTAFIVAGSVMVLTSILFLLDPLWKAVDMRILQKPVRPHAADHIKDITSGEL